MRRTFIFLVFLSSLTFLSGCGNSEPKLVEVKGTVTLDGVPLADGFMYFKTIETGSLERIEIKCGE